MMTWFDITLVAASLCIIVVGLIFTIAKWKIDAEDSAEDHDRKLVNRLRDGGAL